MREGCFTHRYVDILGLSEFLDDPNTRKPGALQDGLNELPMRRIFNPFSKVPGGIIVGLPQDGGDLNC